jgi:hypothetical protein
MNEPKQAKEYTLLKNDQDEILLVLKSIYNTPPSEQALVIYDGGDHAIFYRDEKNTIILDYVHPVVRELVMEQKQIYIAELDEEVLKYDYMAKLEVVKKIPDVEKYIKEKPNLDEAVSRVLTEVENQKNKPKNKSKSQG